MAEEPVLKPAAGPPADGDLAVSSLAVAKLAVAVLTGLCMVLALAVVYLLLERRSRPSTEMLENLVVQDRVIDRLAHDVGGCWDSFPDPDVGRVLLPQLQNREYRNTLVSSNRFGMREREYVWRKPRGLVRIVLLGDSFVFGFGSDQDRRLGVYLERLLRDRSATQGAGIEVLHLAASSWNIIGECSYLRRQLSNLRPDLVIHQICMNDLGDQAGVRGFGGMSKFSPQVRERANGIIETVVPSGLWQKRIPNLLPAGLDWESRSRYTRAAAEIDRLVAALDATGGRYLLLSVYHPHQDATRELLAAGLQEDQQAYFPQSFGERSDLWTEDGHWNPRGHECVAQLLFGLIVDRGLLPQLELRPWQQAQDATLQVFGEGLREVMRPSSESFTVSSRLIIPPTTADNAAQIYGGVDSDGRVAPYASFVLATGGGRSLSLRGQVFAVPELRGGTTRVLVDEHQVGTIDLGTRGAHVRFELPPEITARPYVSVRLISDDWVYSNHRGFCAAFKLEEAAIE